MKKEEEIDQAIDQMQTYLTSGNCQKAIDMAEDIGRQNDNPLFIQVHASAYMCRAGFSELTFIDFDIDRIDSTPDGFMASLTTFTSSTDTTADSAKYNDLKEALDILLNLNPSAQPSQAARNVAFGPRKAGDIALQALIVSLGQLGKYLKVYGNVDAVGAKGQGSNVNECFVEYTFNLAQLYLDGTTNGGACDDIGVDLGHPGLDFAPAASLAITKRRMCEGLMLVTNILNIVNEVDLSSNESLEELTEIVQTLNDYRDFVTTTSPALGTLLSTTSQTTCESLIADSTQFNNMQFIFALLFEKGLP